MPYFDSKSESLTPKLYPSEHISVEGSQGRHIQNRDSLLSLVLEKVVQNRKNARLGFSTASRRYEKNILSIQDWSYGLLLGCRWLREARFFEDSSD